MNNTDQFALSENYEGDDTSSLDSDTLWRGRVGWFSYIVKRKWEVMVVSIFLANFRKTLNLVTK